MNKLTITCTKQETQTQEEHKIEDYPKTQNKVHNKICGIISIR